LLGVKILTPCDVLVVLRFAGLCGVDTAGLGVVIDLNVMVGLRCSDVAVYMYILYVHS
jgi:hypothetical protein